MANTLNLSRNAASNESNHLLTTLMKSVIGIELA